MALNKQKYTSLFYENLLVFEKIWADPIDLSLDFYPEVRTKKYITVGMKGVVGNVGCQVEMEWPED